MRRYHRHTVPTFPSLAKRVGRCPVPQIRTQLARRHYNYTAPFIYNKINLTLKIKCLNDYQMKNKVAGWLLKLNYNEVEDLFAVLK